MDVKKLRLQNENQLSGIKKLFSKFVSVAKEINDLHESTCFFNDKTVNSGAANPNKFADISNRLLEKTIAKASSADRIFTVRKELKFTEGVNGILANTDTNIDLTQSGITGVGDHNFDDISNGFLEKTIAKASNADRIVTGRKELNFADDGNETFGETNERMLIVVGPTFDGVSEIVEETILQDPNVDGTSATAINVVGLNFDDVTNEIFGKSNVTSSNFDDDVTRMINCVEFNFDDELGGWEAINVESDDSACSNVTITTHTGDNRVMGIKFPSDSTFIQKRLESTANDELDCVEASMVIEPTVESSSVNEVFDMLEAESMDYVTFEFDNDNITQTTLEPVNDNLNALVKPSSKNEDFSSWNVADMQRHQGCDDVNMFVPTSDSKVKKLCCMFCLKRYTKLARHLESVHKSESAVKRFRELKKGSKARRAIIDMIRKKGQFLWNTNSKINGGELIPSRRPNKNFPKDASGFSSCPKCLVSLSVKGLSHHFQKCTGNSLKGERIVLELARSVEGRIRFDWLIIAFGNDLCINLHPVYQIQIIRSKLRYAGNLLLAAKSISGEITDFASLYHVKHCNVVIEAVRRVSKFDLGAKTIKSPATATTLVTLVKAIGELLVIEKIKEDNREEENVERFLKVFTKDAKLKVNKLATVTQAKAKRERKADIPSTEDVNRFVAYLDSERDKCFAELCEEYSYEKWELLSELTLVSILVFNRRRIGEMQNITVSDFERREMIAEHRDKLVPGALPEYTSQLIKSRLIIRGKLNRPVPVLLKHAFDECVQLLLHHRKDARISQQNEYIFAVYTKTGRIRTVGACKAIVKFANSCSAENPGSLRATKLRKHLASMCATLNLPDNTITNVANFMGHDKQIHLGTYRHVPVRHEVVEMAEVLQAVQGIKVTNTDLSSTSEKTVDQERTVISTVETNPVKIVPSKTIRKRKSPVQKRIMANNTTNIPIPCVDSDSGSIDIGTIVTKAKKGKINRSQIQAKMKVTRASKQPTDLDQGVSTKVNATSRKRKSGARKQIKFDQAIAFSSSSSNIPTVDSDSKWLWSDPIRL